jgi:hypothetical protein
MFPYLAMLALPGMFALSGVKRASLLLLAVAFVYWIMIGFRYQVGMDWPYSGPFQAGQPLTVTSSCNATSTWLAASTNAPPPPPAQRGERGR